jgi:antirestriction protein ArdC
MPSGKVVYRDLVDTVLADLERGVMPWRKPWVVRRPTNLFTRLPYGGLNQLLLAEKAAGRGFTSHFWLTARQALQRGGVLRAGEESKPVMACSMYWYQYMSRGVPRWGFGGKSFALYNVDQTFGLGRLLPNDAQLSLWTPGPAEAIARKWEDAPQVRSHPSGAFYSPTADRIAMPPRETFVVENEYYATLFHEMVHATGHRSRLGRLGLPERDSSFGSPDYAFEELVAELGAKFLCAEAGIANECAQNNSSYIGNWLQTLRNDRRQLHVAASHAERACDLILGRRPKRTRPTPCEDEVSPEAMSSALSQIGETKGDHADASERTS